MLTWSIKAKKIEQPQARVKIKYRAGSYEHKQSILNHTLKNNGFKLGDRVLTDDYEQGQIFEIVDSVGSCDWLGLKPMPIGVWMEHYNCVMYYHPNSLALAAN